MTSRDEHRVRVVENLAAHLLATGLSRTSVRQLAAAAGISDRMLLYYFADKTEVMRAALGRLMEGLVTDLDRALPVTPRLSARDLMVQASSLTTGPAMAPFMRLWIEILAQAAQGEAPFVEIAHEIAAGFTLWIEARLEPAPGANPKALASALLAILDGLALLGVCADLEEVQSAAQALSALIAPPPA